MLIQLVLQHPQALVKIVQSTPGWVWGLLAGLLALGVSQLRDREVSLLRASVMPFAMFGLSAWSMAGAFGSAPHGAMVIALWLAVATFVGGLSSLGDSGARYEAQARTYRVPGSVLPLFLIVGMFLVKWSVGVELALQPAQAHDTAFGIAIAATYGVFNGLFAGRAARLWRLALRTAPAPAIA